MSIEETLADRKKTHGRFDLYAYATQDLKDVIEVHQIDTLDRVQREALDMIFGKIARIITGDQTEVDHWHDIAGYATLVEKHLKGEL